MKLTRQQKAERNRLIYALAMSLHRAMVEQALQVTNPDVFAGGAWRPTWWAATGAELGASDPPAEAAPSADACSEDLAGVAE